MSDANGKPSLKVDERWVLADAGAKTFLGLPMRAHHAEGSLLREEWKPWELDLLDALPGHDVVVLEPCYEIMMQQGQSPNGQPMVGLQAIGFSLLGHTCRVNVRWQSLTLFRDMHEHDRQYLRELVKVAEQTKNALRAQRAGIISAARV